MHNCANYRKKAIKHIEARINRQAEKAYENFKANVWGATRANKKYWKKMEFAVSAFFEKQGKEDPTKNFNWDYILVDNKVVNAWCMPEEKLLFILDY